MDVQGVCILVISCRYFSQNKARATTIGLEKFSIQMLVNAWLG